MAQDSLKARFWVGILWINSMRDDWKKHIDLLLQMPYVYCVHNKDVKFDGDLKDPHVHIMVAYPNTTTEKNIISIFNEFSKPCMQCCNKAFRVRGVEYMYNYLIHDTEYAKKQGKYLYSPSERVEGLGWDTKLFNQEQQIDRLRVVMELTDFIEDHNITNYIDLSKSIVHNFDLSYFEIFLAYSGHFDRLVKGQWLKLQK